MPLERRLQILDASTEDQFMETALKVAFASSDMKTVNQHFGAASAFVLYAVDMETAHMVEVVQFGQVDKDGNEDKLAAKIEALSGCVAVYAQAIGASAIGQLKAQEIQPVKVTAGTPVAELIESLQAELRSGPAAWLARAIRRHSASSAERFDAMEAEGWEE